MAAILKIENTQQLGRGSSDLHQILQVDVEIGADLIFDKYCENFKIQEADGCHLKIENNCSELRKKTNINTTEVV